MREALLAEVPHEECNSILATAEVAGDVDVVVVGVARRGSSLETSFKNNHLTINPHPIFAVDSDVGKGSLVAQVIDGDTLVEAEPRITLLGGGRAGYPLGLPHLGIGKSGREGKEESEKDTSHSD